MKKTSRPDGNLYDIFQHYYKFVSVGAFLNLSSQYGRYSAMENNKATVTELVTTTSQKLLLKHLQGNEPFKLLNPFKMAWRGLVHYNNFQDTVYVIIKPSLQEIEFFIRENSKSVETIIMQLANSGKLEAEIDYIRKKAKAIV